MIHPGAGCPKGELYPDKQLFLLTQHVINYADGWVLWKHDISVACKSIVLPLVSRIFVIDDAVVLNI